MFVSLLIFVVLFLIVWEVLTIIFSITGMEQHKARFQVLVMLTAIGYSSKESESIIQHPIRRKIAMFCMLYAYINNLCILMILINMQKSSFDLVIICLTLLLMLILIIIIRNIQIIESKIKYWFMKTQLFSTNKSNIYRLLSKNNKYGLYNIYVGDKFKFINQTLECSPLKSMGIQVLNIDKGHKVEFAPTADYKIELGDCLLVYCNMNKIKNCFK